MAWGGSRSSHRCLSPSEGSQLYLLSMLVIPAGSLSAQGKNALTHPFDSPARFYGVFVSSAVQAAPHKLEPWLPGRKDRASSAAQGPFGSATPASDNWGHTGVRAVSLSQATALLGAGGPASGAAVLLKLLCGFLFFSLFLPPPPQVPRAGDSASGFIQKSLRVSDPHEASQCLDLLE